MSVMIQKSLVLEAIDTLADETTIELVMEKIHFLGKIDKGLKQVDAGEVMEDAELRRQIAKWLD